MSVPDTAPHWNDALAALQRYQSQRGTTDVGPNIRAYGIDLGKWVARCRDDYWDGQLDLDHVAALEAVTGWHWGAEPIDSWRHVYHVLAAYAHRTGTTIAQPGTVVEGVDVSAWSAAQRQAYIDLELTGPQIHLLEELTDWQWDADTARWRDGIAAATRWIADQRTLESVHRDTRLQDYPLGHWLHRCREDYRAGSLTPERAAELEALPGWSWGRHHDTWDEGLRVLRAFVQREGHACPSQHTVVDGHRIGWWVTQVRRRYRGGTLPTDQASVLENLPGWQWDPLEHRWQQGFDALVRYLAQHGDASPGRGEIIDGYRVGEWADVQRKAHKAGRLNSERADRLEALPGWRWRTTVNR